MASLIASKKEILRESRKIKTSPSTHQVKLLKFKKKLDYKKFVNWVDSSDDTLKRVKLPKRSELLNFDSNLGMIMGLGIANFWKEIKALLEKFGFGNWKVGLGVLAAGLLGLREALRRLNPFRRFKGVRRGPLNKLKRLRKTFGRPFDKRRKVKIQRAKNIKKIRRQKGIDRFVKRIKRLNPFKKRVPIKPGNNIVPFSRTSKGLNTVKTITKVKPRFRGARVGGPLSAIFAGLTFHDRKVNQNQSNVKAITGTVAETACGAALGAKGAAAGATIGSVVPGAGTVLGGIIGGLVGGSLGAMLCGSASDAIVDTVEGNQSNVIEGASQCVDCGNQSSSSNKSSDKSIKPSEKIVSSDNLIKSSEKTIVVSEKLQTNEDGDTTIVLVPSQQQQIIPSPVPSGGIVPFPVSSGGGSPVILSGPSESETLNNMWTNILLTKLA